MHLIWPVLTISVHVGLVVWLVTLILLRPRGTSDARLAWIVFIVLAPILGAVAYMFLAAPRIAGRRRRTHAYVHAAFRGMRRDRIETLVEAAADIPSPYDRVFSLAGAVSETDVIGGNQLTLSRTPEEFTDDFIADLDAATSTIHVLTYIYLDDEVGRRVGEHLMAASAKGVTVRLQVDSVGSRDFLHSDLRRRIEDAGVQLVEMLPARIIRVMFARMDLRNHRKIAVIDNRVGWVGSRNIASPAFAPKARYAPWVDCMARLQGPALHDLQTLFVEDWRVGTGESLDNLLREPTQAPVGSSCCQIVGTGPNFNNDALPQVLQACFYAARDELVLTTAYYVPDVATEAALRSAALRGVRTTLIVPARNDSHLVGLASRSHYAGLIDAGVSIHEFTPGLLHAKTMTVDHSLFMMGSANLDRRSLELNFEVSLFGWCPEFASRLRFLQQAYLEDSRPVNAHRWTALPAPQRLLHNLAGLLSPLL